MSGVYITASLDLQTEDDFFMKNVEFNSDNVWIFEDVKTSNIFQLDTRRAVNNVTPNLPFTNMLCISLVHLKDVYYRSYIKVQAILANVGAFIKLFTMLFGFINSYFDDFGMMYELKEKLNDMCNSHEKDNSNKTMMTNINIRVTDLNKVATIHDNSVLTLQENKISGAFFKLKTNLESVKIKKFKFSEKLKILLCRCCLKGKIKKDMSDFRKFKNEIMKKFEMSNILFSNYLTDLLYHESRENRKNLEQMKLYVEQNAN